MADHRPFTLLLIEDTPDDEMLALRALRSCGLPLFVRVARDGPGARRALGLDDEPGTADCQVPDLVLSDLKIPGYGGDEVLRRARADARFAHVPYVIFSSSSEPEDVVRCLAFGASAYAQKPVGFQEYIECVGSLARWSLAPDTMSKPPPCVIAAPRCSCGYQEAA